MPKLIFNNILRFIILVILQVLVFNNIHVFSYLSPFIYIIFVFLLPFNTPRWILLLSGFFMGLCLDFFSNTGGVHTAATILIAFIRPWVQNIITPTHEYETGMQPGIKGLGFKWFFLYTLILTSIHHVCYYYLEIFSFDNFFRTLKFALLNVAFSMFFILIFQYLFYKRK